MTEPRLGGCQCGAVRFSSSGPARALYACHCHECRKQSASAFGMSLVVPRDGLVLLRGTPRSWTRPTDSGRQLRCLFCGECGSRLWHEGSVGVAAATLKAGALDEPVDFSTAIHIWTDRKLPGVVIPPGAVQYPRKPPD